METLVKLALNYSTAPWTIKQTIFTFCLYSIGSRNKEKLALMVKVFFKQSFLFIIISYYTICYMMTVSAAVLNEYQGKDVASGKPHLFHPTLLVENDAYAGDLLRKRNKIDTLKFEILNLSSNLH